MKKFKFFFGFVIIAITVILFGISSCSKQELNEDQVLTAPESRISDEDMTFVNNLVVFRDKVQSIRENPYYKDEEFLDADEAIEYMETLFNATYGFPDEHYSHTQTDRTTVLIDVNASDEVEMDDVVTTFDEIINIVTQYYYLCEFEDKGFILLDLDRGGITNNQLEIGLRSVIGEKTNGWDPFGEDDYWWYGNEAGDCEWNNGGTDAAEKIEIAVNSNKPLVSPPPGYQFVYGVVEEIDLFGDEYENESGEKLIFYIANENGYFTQDEQCLNPDEMNFHFYGEEEVIYFKVPTELNKPNNWTFLECDLDGNWALNPNNGYVPAIRHSNQLSYALRYLVPTGIIDPPVELD